MKKVTSPDYRTYLLKLKTVLRARETDEEDALRKSEMRAEERRVTDRIFLAERRLFQ